MHIKCGYIWNVEANSLLSSHSHCPKCSHKKRGIDRRKTTEQYKQEVFDLVGDEYELVGEYKKATSYVNMKHNKCGFVFPVKPGNFLCAGSRCPNCTKYILEERAKVFFINNNIDYIPQKKFPGLRKIRLLKVDYYLPDYNLVVELDGKQHFEPEDFAERGKEWAKQQFIETQEKDEIKNKYFLKQNIPLLRIKYDQDVEGVLQRALDNIPVNLKDAE